MYGLTKTSEPNQSFGSRKSRPLPGKTFTPAASTAAILQRARMAPMALTRSDVAQLQKSIGNRAVCQLFAGMQLQSAEGTVPAAKVMLPQQQGSHTGLPEHLKAGVENLSGFDLSAVRVHYNSSKPAELGALAYTQGADIHVAPGQERHLPHEAWHVVQQAQGRVRPTLQQKGLRVNDDARLEREADLMGGQAVSIFTSLNKVFQVKGSKNNNGDICQFMKEENEQQKLLNPQPVDKSFTPEQIEFVTVNKDRKIGSIYFPRGRIRLVHRDGPLVETVDNVKRFTIDKQMVKQIRGKSPDEKYQLVTAQAHVGQELDPKKRLIEFFVVGGVPISHLSRGRPVKNIGLGLNQEQLNIICRAAQTHDNWELYNAMGADDRLRDIRDRMHDPNEYSQPIRSKTHGREKKCCCTIL